MFLDPKSIYTILNLNIFHYYQFQHIFDSPISSSEFQDMNHVLNELLLVLDEKAPMLLLVMDPKKKKLQNH